MLLAKTPNDKIKHSVAIAQSCFVSVTRKSEYFAWFAEVNASCGTVDSEAQEKHTEDVFRSSKSTPILGIMLADSV